MLSAISASGNNLGNEIVEELLNGMDRWVFNRPLSNFADGRKWHTGLSSDRLLRDRFGPKIVHYELIHVGVLFHGDRY